MGPGPDPWSTKGPTGGIMFLFILCVLACGILTSIIDSAFFIFAIPRLEKYPNGELNAVGVIWFILILVLILFPLSRYIVFDVLHYRDQQTFQKFISYWAVILIGVRVYWSIRFIKRFVKVQAEFKKRLSEP
jgi:hypothetical protein